MFIYSIASLISLLNYYKNVPNGPIASENADINIIYVKTIFCRIILPWLTIPTYRMLWPSWGLVGNVANRSSLQPSHACSKTKSKSDQRIEERVGTQIVYYCRIASFKYRDLENRSRLPWPPGERHPASESCWARPWAPGKCRHLSPLRAVAAVVGPPQWRP